MENVVSYEKLVFKKITVNINQNSNDSCSPSIEQVIYIILILHIEIIVFFSVFHLKIKKQLGSFKHDNAIYII